MRKFAVFALMVVCVMMFAIVQPVYVLLSSFTTLTHESFLDAE